MTGRQLPQHCDHDWRVNPHIVLPSNPPQQRLVCAKCKAITSRTAPGAQHIGPTDVGDWPSAKTGNERRDG